MKQIYMASVLMASGIILIVASLLLPYFAPSTLNGTWTKEQGEAHSKTSAELHALAHEMGHAHTASGNHKEGDEAELKRRFEETQKRYDEGDAQLRQAQEMPDRIVFWMRCIGAVLLAVGLAVFFRTNR